MNTAAATKSTKKTQIAIEITPAGVSAIALELRTLSADVFALYLKTKNFHWLMTGPQFRDYHLLLDEQTDQIFAMTDVIAERTRKLRETTLHSSGDITRHQRIEDNEQTTVVPKDMLKELLASNSLFATNLGSAHELCSSENDFETTSLIENRIDETERQCWFLTDIPADWRFNNPTEGLPCL